MGVSSGMVQRPETEACPTLTLTLLKGGACATLDDVPARCCVDAARSQPLLLLLLLLLANPVCCCCRGEAPALAAAATLLRCPSHTAPALGAWAPRIELTSSGGGHSAGAWVGTASPGMRSSASEHEVGPALGSRNGLLLYCGWQQPAA